MEKKEKTYKSSFYTYNLNLKSNTRKGGVTFSQVLLNNEHSKKGVQMKANTVMYFRKVFKTNVENEDVVYGNVARNIDVQGLEWKNRETAEIVDVQIPIGAVPGLKEVFFAYSEKHHRILIQENPSFSPKVLQEFLSVFFNSFINIEGEHLNVVVEQSKDELKVLKKARKISRVFVKLTYTNDDFNKDSEELMDRLIRESGFGELEINGKSSGNAQIKIEGDLVNGALGLATENGFAIVNYKDEHGKRSKLNTLDHPEIATITVIDKNSALNFAIEAIKKLFKIRDERGN